MKPEDVTDEMLDAAALSLDVRVDMSRAIAAAINASPLYSAAPQMLEALEEILLGLDYGELTAYEGIAIATAHVAIAAATGEKE